LAQRVRSFTPPLCGRAACVKVASAATAPKRELV
jgi:hypothetical protein